MIETDRDKAAEGFLKMTEDLCGDKWLESQQVHCQLKKGHISMHQALIQWDGVGECDLWWNRGEDHDRS